MVIAETLNKYESSPPLSSASTSSPPESEALSSPLVDYVPDWDFEVASESEDNMSSHDTLIDMGSPTPDAIQSSLLLPPSNPPPFLSALQTTLGLPGGDDFITSPGFHQQDSTDAVDSGDRPAAQDSLHSRQDMPVAFPDLAKVETGEPVERKVESTKTEASTQTDYQQATRRTLVDVWVQTGEELESLEMISANAIPSGSDSTHNDTRIADGRNEATMTSGNPPPEMANPDDKQPMSSGQPETSLIGKGDSEAHEEGKEEGEATVQTPAVAVLSDAANDQDEHSQIESDQTLTAQQGQRKTTVVSEATASLPDTAVSNPSETSREGESAVSGSRQTHPPDAKETASPGGAVTDSETSAAEGGQSMQSEQSVTQTQTQVDVVQHGGQEAPIGNAAAASDRGEGEESKGEQTTTQITASTGQNGSPSGDGSGALDPTESQLQTESESTPQAIPNTENGAQGGTDGDELQESNTNHVDSAESQTQPDSGRTHQDDKQGLMGGNELQGLGTDDVDPAHSESTRQTISNAHDNTQGLTDGDGLQAGVNNVGPAEHRLRPEPGNTHQDDTLGLTGGNESQGSSTEGDGPADFRFRLGGTHETVSNTEDETKGHRGSVEQQRLGTEGGEEVDQSLVEEVKNGPAPTSINQDAGDASNADSITEQTSAGTNAMSSENPVSEQNQPANKTHTQEDHIDEDYVKIESSADLIDLGGGDLATTTQAATEAARSTGDEQTGLRESERGAEEDVRGEEGQDQEEWQTVTTGRKDAWQTTFNRRPSAMRSQSGNDVKAHILTAVSVSRTRSVPPTPGAGSENEEDGENEGEEGNEEGGRADVSEGGDGVRDRLAGLVRVVTGGRKTNAQRKAEKAARQKKKKEEKLEKLKLKDVSS